MQLCKNKKNSMYVRFSLTLIRFIYNFISNQNLYIFFFLQLDEMARKMCRAHLINKTALLPPYSCQSFVVCCSTCYETSKPFNMFARNSRSMQTAT